MSMKWYFPIIFEMHFRNNVCTCNIISLSHHEQVACWWRDKLLIIWKLNKQVEIFLHISTSIMYLYMLPGIALQLFSVINNWNQKLSYINFFGVLIVWNYEASYCICKRPYIFECVKSQPTFQCWINIVTT